MSTPEKRIAAAREAWETDGDIFDLSPAIDDLFAAVDELSKARTTAEHWKAEHLAGNERIAELERELAFLKSERVPPAYFAPLLPKKGRA